MTDKVNLEKSQLIVKIVVRTPLNKTSFVLFSLLHRILSDEQ